MSDEETNQIMEGLKKTKCGIMKPSEIEQYLSKFKISNDKMITLLEKMTEGYIFRWLDFICTKLTGLANEERFLDLLEKIILKIQNDMAQGPFIRSLIQIGENNSNLGLSLYNKMMASNSRQLIDYSSFPLGGAGKSSFLEAFELVEKGLSSEKPEIAASALKALRVIFEEKTELIKTEEIFANLDRLTKEEKPVEVQIEAMKAYFDFSRFANKKAHCFQKLSELASRDNSYIRFNLANMLLMGKLSDPEIEIDVLALCAEDRNEVTLSRVALALSEKGSKFPEKSLGIIKGWILKGNYQSITEIEYALQRIGKSNEERCIKEIKTWVQEEDKKVLFFVPEILTKTLSNDYEKLVENLDKWSSESSNLQKIALRTLRSVLTEAYSTPKLSAKLVDHCFSILERIAQEKGIDVKRLLRGETEKFYQCFLLINEIELDRKAIDFKVVSENLPNFPSIKLFLSEKWFKEMEKKNRTHPLLTALCLKPDKEKIAEKTAGLQGEKDELRKYFIALGLKEMLRPYAFLQYLEEMLETICKRGSRLKGFRSGLRNEDQFWETVSEIEIVSSFIQDYETEIAPKLGRKKLDVEINIKPERILVEVIYPKMFKPLLYMTGRAFGIPNKARGLIYQEFKKHLEGIDIKDFPVIIAINTSRSMIDYDYVEDYLMGTLQLTLLVNKEDGKVVRTQPSRADNSMHKLRNQTDVLSAISCYRVFFGNDGKFHREGKVIVNPNAINPLTSDAISKIEKAIFK